MLDLKPKLAGLRLLRWEAPKLLASAGWVGGRTVYPIHVAVKHGDTRLVRLLLAERADPRQVSQVIS